MAMNVGFIGGGRMAQALARGFLSAGLTRVDNIVASCAPNDAPSIDALKEIGVEVVFDNKKIIEKSEVTIVAVKPGVMGSVLNDIKGVVHSRHLLLSVAMGVPIQKIEQVLGSEVRVVRVMPNTPALVGEGATVFARGTGAGERDAHLTKTLFGSVGTCEEVAERHFDAVTALSGSGPAYIYTVIEALADGGVRMGLPRDLAYTLAAQTVVGAGQMVLTTRQHPAQLKDHVTSPAGSTCEGLYRLEIGGVRGALLSAVEEATLKARRTSEQQKGS